MKLDLGCGKKPEEGYVGVDLPLDEGEPFDDLAPLQPRIDDTGIVRFDLCSGIPWPFADGSVEGLFSSHVIEHLPAGRITVYEWEPTSLGRQLLRRNGTQDALFWFLDEAWRVCKPGGEFLLRWPALRDEQTGELCMSAFQDPTHYRFIPVEQIPYWSRRGRATLDVSQYRASCDWVCKELCQRRLGGETSKIVENQVLFLRGA